jgi:cytochrome c oxidase assembly protein subunit 11
MKRPSNALLGFALAGGVLVMFSVAYANVPLFKMFCQRFGLGGTAKAGSKEATWQQSSSTGPMAVRDIQVKFMGVVGSGLPVRFGPSDPVITAKIGKPVHLLYTFTNMSDDSVFFRAVHSIAPVEAAREFQLMQCFCFDDQSLAPRQTVKLPVYFALSPRTPSNVHEVILSYSLFPRDPDRPLPIPAKEAN